MAKVTAAVVNKIRRMHAEIQALGSEDLGYTDSGLWEFLRHVKTKDEHDDDMAIKPLVGEGDTYIIVALLYMLACKKLLIPKSRQVRMSWITVTYCLWRAMSRPNRLVTFQTKKEEDAHDMITMGNKYPCSGRCDFILQNLPEWLIDPNVASGTGNRAGSLMLSPFRTDQNGIPIPWQGSQVRGVPGGAEQVRSKTGTLVVFDEGAFHDDFGEAVAAAMPAVNGGGQFIGVSSVWKGSDFNQMVLDGVGEAGPVHKVHHVVQKALDLWGIEWPHGMKSWETPSGVWVLEVHYTADPKKDPAREGAEWFEEAPKGYTGGVTSQKWKREMEIDYEAGGGEPVFEFATPESPIYINAFEPQAIMNKMRFYAGYDWGSNNPSAFEVWGIDKDGVPYAVWELYEPCHDMGRHVERIKACPYWDRIEYIMCDPTITNRDIVTAAGKRTLAADFEQFGLAMSGSRRGQDVTIAQMFRSRYWSCPDKPKAFITKACPNLWKEVMGLRWREHSSPVVAARKNAPEEILDKNNHAWDATSYLFDSRPQAWLAASRLSPGAGTFGRAAADLRMVAERERRKSGGIQVL